MAMDGLSFSNTGAVKESTSAEMASKTEHAIQTSMANDASQVQNLGANQKVKAKDDEEQGENKGKKQAPQKDIEDEFVESSNGQDDSEDFDVEDLENPNKDFYVKLNAKDDIIELYDSTTDRLIETISGNELGDLVQKLNMASGIFVNKKV